MKSHALPVESHDLDLLPVMNLFSILIPFLLSVAVFQKIAIMPVDMPTRSLDGGEVILDTEHQLGMSAFITSKAVKLWAWNQPVFEEELSWKTHQEEEIPLIQQNGEWVEAMPIIQGKLEEIYNRGIDMPDVSQATLVAETDVKTQQVIQMMDLLKDSGFSGLNLARLGAP